MHGHVIIYNIITRKKTIQLTKYGGDLDGDLRRNTLVFETTHEHSNGGNPCRGQTERVYETNITIIYIYYLYERRFRYKRYFFFLY